MKRNKLSTQPYKGARDFYPEDMRVRSYIFDTWRRVCKRYGFEEYDFPIMEPFEIFAAKTGEEIVKEQMYTLTDRGGRRLAIRPELTPGTVRMLAQKYNELLRPVRWFMIGNNWRAEKPQLGRGREFYQLEVNIFGIEDCIADFEIFSIMIDILKAFGAKREQFSVLFSDRRLITGLLNDYLKLDKKSQPNVRRLMDKRSRMEKREFFKGLADLGLQDKQAKAVEDFMNADLDSLKKVIPENILKENQGYKNILALFKLLEENNLGQYCKFDPSIIRGFDYSDGLVYEVFDNNPANNRSMFGGERFDNLIKIFGDYDLAATGFAMGDYTLNEFLKAWNLLPSLPQETKVLVTIFDENTRVKSFEIVQRLREAGINTATYLEPDKLDKQLKYADRKGIPFVIILGPEEIEKGTVQLKDMKTQRQKELTLVKVIETLRSNSLCC